MGIDPGFASTGVVVARLNGLVVEDFAFTTIRTKKAKKGSLIYASQDNANRTKQLARDLKLLFDDFRPDAVCVEAMSFPRNASVAAKMALCWGVIGALSELYKAPILQASPQVIKQRLTGSKSASKEEVELAVRNLVGTDRVDDALTLAQVIKGQKEHAMDALAACVVLGNEPEIWTRKKA